MKLLTVVIPAYNVEKYLHRCLDSLLYDESVRKYLDIIIVDDGSHDNTAKVAEEYCNKYDEVSLISKENGGHGSTINAGLKQATGKYFKVVDADDWVNVADFSKFVGDLEREDADILITDFKQDVLYSEELISFDFFDGDNSTHDISDIADSVTMGNFFFRFSMHSMTVKRVALEKVWGDGLLEKTFYVDQQYVAKVLSCAKDYKVLNYDIYRYFIGRPDQSVNSFGKHKDDHERVLLWLMSFYYSEDIQNRDYLSTVLKHQITLMLRTHRRAYQEEKRSIAHSRAKKNFELILKKKYPDFELKGGK